MGFDHRRAMREKPQRIARHRLRAHARPDTRSKLARALARMTTGLFAAATAFESFGVKVNEAAEAFAKLSRSMPNDVTREA